MTKGTCGPAVVKLRRGGETLTVSTARVSPDMKQLQQAGNHDRPGDTFQKLSNDVAYLKLSSVKAADADRYVESAAGSNGLIIDIRNYPSEFMVFALGSHLVDKPTEFATFTHGDIANPGAFYFNQPPVSLTPKGLQYQGKIVILVDEVSLSQSDTRRWHFVPRRGRW